MVSKTDVNSGLITAEVVATAVVVTGVDVSNTIHVELTGDVI